MTTHDTAAALWSAIDAYGCDAASHGALGRDATTRAALLAAIAAHVEAEVARRLEAAPEVEAAIETHGDACYERGFRHALKSDAVDSELDAAYDRLRAAFAADKARAVESARLTPDEAHRMINELIGATAIIGNGLDDDPGAVVAKRIAKDARMALLRALGGRGVTALVRQVQPSRPRPLIVTPWFVAVWSLMFAVQLLGLAGVL